MKFKWTKIEQEASKEIKRILVCDVLLVYPGSIGKIKIHTNASDFQLRAVISQYGKPITLYGRKLTGFKMRYTVA